MSIKTCTLCGGLYATESGEMFAGTPCTCAYPATGSFGDDTLRRENNALRLAIAASRDDAEKAKAHKTRLECVVDTLRDSGGKLYDFYISKCPFSNIDAQIWRKDVAHSIDSACPSASPASGDCIESATQLRNLLNKSNTRLSDLLKITQEWVAALESSSEGISTTDIYPTYIKARMELMKDAAAIDAARADAARKEAP